MCRRSCCCWSHACPHCSCHYCSFCRRVFVASFLYQEVYSLHFGNTRHLDNEIDWADSERLEGVKISTASLNDHFVFTIVHGVIVLAANLRRNCTFLHSVRSSLHSVRSSLSLLRYGVKVEGPHKRGHCVLMLCSFTNQLLV